ncbi:diacylglycerol kinase, partial [Gemmiger formicilis]|uniref:diacylglycerol kinase n=1 Tax=Gemmiger formicilis TaxID=745368 RepID=UPI003D313C73
MHKMINAHSTAETSAKDMAAGAVLIVALGALCIGCVLLIPRLSVIVDHLRT